MGVVMGLAALIIQLITIRQVRCFLGDHEVSADFGVCVQLQTLIGTRLLLRDFTQDTPTAALLYLDQTKEVFDIQKTERSLAGTVVFYLSAQPPLYRLERDGQLLLVTQAGSFRANNDQVQAPLVADPALVYQHQPAEVHAFLSQFLLGLGDKRNMISQIILESPAKIKVHLSGLPVVLLELQQQPQLAAADLVLLLEKLKPAEIDLAARELDLRFTLPVLRTFDSSDSTVIIDSQE